MKLGRMTGRAALASHFDEGVVACSRRGKSFRRRLEGVGGQGFALSDPWKSLGPKQRYIVSKGRVLTGRFVVWRNPVQHAADVQAWIFR